MTDFGHWVLADTAIYRDDALGFVYLVTHLPTGKKYLGKKQLIRNVKLKPLKGKTKSRRKIKESDWKTYTSSSNILNEWYLRDGPEAFKFEILSFHSCKSMLNYTELLYQVQNDVLRNEDFLNQMINIRLSKIKSGY